MRLDGTPPSPRTLAVLRDPACLKARARARLEIMEQDLRRGELHMAIRNRSAATQLIRESLR